jgi:hypothetical protein
MSLPSSVSTAAALAAQSFTSSQNNGGIPLVSSLPSSQDEEEKRFMGKKERRRSSAHKYFQGDYLNLSNNTTVLKILAKHGERSVKFADYIHKVNKRMKMQERVLVITEAAIYNMDHHYRIKRRIPIRELGCIMASCLPDNFFCLHIPSEYDYILVSSRKVEIIVLLLSTYERQANKSLPVILENR